MTDPAQTRPLLLDPSPFDTLRTLHDRHPRVADAIEDALDWIAADPPDPRAKRRRFTNGVWAITVYAGGEEWLVIWEEPTPDEPFVRHIGESTSL